MKIEFDFDGKAVAKARPRFGAGGRVYTPKTTADFERDLKSVAPASMLSGALKLEITVFVEIPKSWSKSKQADAAVGHIRPSSRPDIDNYAKSILDALNDHTWLDDCQVCDLHIQRFYAQNASIKISVEEI